MVSRLETNNIIFEDRSIYKYGIELFVSVLVSTIIILFIGIIFNSLLEAIIYEILFIITRGSFGGYHCKSYFRCNSLFAFTFIFSLIIQRNVIFKLSQIIMVLIIEIVIVGYCCPVKNVYKLLSVNEYKKIKLNQY